MRVISSERERASHASILESFPPPSRRRRSATRTPANAMRKEPSPCDRPTAQQTGSAAQQSLGASACQREIVVVHHCVRTVLNIPAQKAASFSTVRVKRNACASSAAERPKKRARASV